MPHTDTVLCSSCQWLWATRSLHSKKLPLLSWGTWVTCWFYLSFFHTLRFTHARSRARRHFWQSPSQGWFTVLTYFSGLPFMSSLFSVSVCWKPRAVRGYWCEGLPGATGAPGRVFCSSYVVLLVTGARRARAPPTGSAWEESERGPV